MDEALGLRGLGQGPQAVCLEGEDVAGCCWVVLDEEALPAPLDVERPVDVATGDRADGALVRCEVQGEEGCLRL